VLDENGEVIGVASQQLMEGQNLNFAIAVEQIKAALSILQRQSAAPKGVTTQKIIPSSASPNGSGFKTEESGSGPTSQVLEALDHELNSVLRQLLEHLDASAQEALKAEQVRW
jgi:S1-C subfamily serine protease